MLKWLRDLIAAIQMALYIRTGNERFFSNEHYSAEMQMRDERAAADQRDREEWDRMEQEQIAAALREDEEHDRSHRAGRYWDPEHCDMCRELLEEEDREELRNFEEARRRENETRPGDWPAHLDSEIERLEEMGYTPETYARDIEDMWDEVDHIEREADEEAV